MVGARAEPVRGGVLYPAGTGDAGGPFEDIFVAVGLEHQVIGGLIASHGIDAGHQATPFPIRRVSVM